jgi:hypothetical protein
MQFERDKDKARANFTKHRVLFETATLVFDDPYAITRFDVFHSDEEQRVITLGLADRRTVLFVVHTYRLEDAKESIRIISARLASPKERRTYEEAHIRTEGKHPRH